MHGTDDDIVHRLLLTGSQIGVHGIQMGRDFGFEDVEQDRIDGGHFDTRIVDGFGNLGRVPGGYGQLRCFLARFGNSLCDHFQLFGFGYRGLRHCFHVLDGQFCLDRDFGFRDCGRHIHGLLASGNPIGYVLHRFKIGVHAAHAFQRIQKFRKNFASTADQDGHCLGRLDGVIEHAIEHVLDLPAEFAQGQCANQAATALEGMKYAPDRLELIQIAGIAEPTRQQF